MSNQEDHSGGCIVLLFIVLIIGMSVVGLIFRENSYWIQYNPPAHLQETHECWYNSFSGMKSLQCFEIGSEEGESLDD